jgi:hypothetical protein
MLPKIEEMFYFLTLGRWRLNFPSVLELVLVVRQRSRSFLMGAPTETVPLRRVHPSRPYWRFLEASVPALETGGLTQMAACSR